MSKISSASGTRHNIKGPYADLCRLWILRLYKEGIADGNEVRALVVRHFGEEADPDQPDQFNRMISFQLRMAERERPVLDGVLKDNLDLLGRHFGLNAVAKEILAFRCIYRINSALENTVDHAVSGPWTDRMIQQVLSVALKRPIRQVEHALARDYPLHASGLVNVSFGMGGNIAGKLSVLQGIVSALTRPAGSIDELLSFAVSRVDGGKLGTESYPHHAYDIELIKCHLKSSLKSRGTGVNILLHGAPGVGKTELVKALATELGLQALEVTQINDYDSEDEHIHPRFRAYLMLQKLLCKSKNGLVLFDEIEDVLPKPNTPGSKFPGKAWLNKQLEENPVPTVWISNSVWQIDPAFMRRFDIVLEVRNPPRSVRGAILAKQLSGLPVDRQWMSQKANDHSITPALASRIAKVIRSADIRDSATVQNSFDRMMSEHKRAVGDGTSGSYSVPNEYRLDWLNTSNDIDAVSKGVLLTQRGKILLYGPPGCGKTAFAHHLAEVMDRPLMLKRGSDLISKWVGETESNLRDMFREATDDEAILLLDEADSFLQDRRGAERSWELTQVNELLTQMENFNGVFICATNFMEHLDRAAMRRFSVKLKFEYLRQDQVVSLFMSTMRQLSGEMLDLSAMQSATQRLSQLTQLTPGDFKAVTNEFILLGKQPSVDGLLGSLTQENNLKESGGKVQIGFTACLR